MVSNFIYVPDIETLSPEDQFFDHYHTEYLDSGCSIRSVYLRVLATGAKRLGILMVLDCVPSPITGRTDLDFLEAYAGVLEILLGRRIHLVGQKGRTPPNA